MHRTAFVVLSAAMIGNVAAGPRAGEVDPTFGNLQGIATYGFDLTDQGSDVASTLAEDAQGRFYLAGTVADGQDPGCLGVMRFSPDGVLDDGYASGGTACVDAPALTDATLVRVHDSLIQENGALLVAGLVGNDSDVGQPFVCRLTALGALDLGFNAAGTPGCHVSAEAQPVIDSSSTFSSIHIASAGAHSVVVSNAIDDQLDKVFPQVYRLGADGVLVPFGNLNVVTPFALQPEDTTLVLDIAVSPANTLLLAGQDPEFAAMIAAFDLATGALDPDFGDNGVTSTGISPPAAATALSVAAFGNITAVGVAASGINQTPLVLRLTPDGELDPEFNGGLVATYNPCAFMLGGCMMFPRAVRISANGSVVFGGEATFNGNPASMWAMRIRPDGEADTDFGSTVPGQAGLAQVDLSSNADRAWGLALQGERVVLGGTMAGGEGESNDNFALVRLADGSLFRDEFEETP